jgi:hypothetical protein
MAIEHMENIGFCADIKVMGPYFQNLMLCVDMVKAIPVFSKLQMEDRVIYM